MKILIRVLGVALFLSGLFWALQGLGIIMWPPESFMLDRREWTTYGLLTAAVGAVLIWLSRARKREP
ncbi:hypothetical protein EKN06_02280 [Croceicoccus ponticola]|uniref:Uncharacterized protein n=2 Tax=Croceicoccus ponticola TaxID=2217664 RepID=A0A437H2G2_9SPHN|nr:hypothetical protein EKN06_02280 [Croceicoccus ponticola]